MSDTQVSAKVLSSGIRWSGLGTISRAAVRTVISIIMARLLAPADFGLFAMASVITGFLSIFQYLGTSGVIVQKKDLSPHIIHSLFFLNTVFGFVLSVGLALSGPLIGRLYGNPDVGPIIQVISVTIFLASLGAIPSSLLNRNMRFDKIARVGVYSSIVQGVVAISMAYSGFGVWSLVVANMIATATDTIQTWYYSGWKPRLQFVWKEVKPLMGFCLSMTGTNVVTYFTSDTDKFIVGKWLGAINLGLYTMAYRLTLQPLDFIYPVLTKVLFPAYSRMQDDETQVQRVYLRACGGIAFITFPLMMGVAILAKPFVLVVLGAKWEAAIPLIIWMAPIGMMLSTVTPTNGVFLSHGRADYQFWLSIITGGIMIGSFIAATQWGLKAVVLTYAAIAVPLVWVKFWLAARLLHFSPFKLIHTLRPYFVCGATMVAALIVARYLSKLVDLPGWLELGFMILIGAIVYIAAVLVVRPPALKDFVQILPTGVRRLLPKKVTEEEADE